MNHNNIIPTMMRFRYCQHYNCTVPGLGRTTRSGRRSSSPSSLSLSSSSQSPEASDIYCERSIGTSSSFCSYSSKNTNVPSNVRKVSSTIVKFYDTINKHQLHIKMPRILSPGIIHSALGERANFTFCYLHARRLTVSNSNASQQQKGPMPPNNFQHPKWITDLDTSKPMDTRRAFKYLQLEHFDEDELKDRFRKILALDKSRNHSETPHSSTDGTPCSAATEELTADSNQFSETPVLSEHQLRCYLEKTIKEFENKNIQHGYSNRYDDIDDDNSPNEERLPPQRQEQNQITPPLSISELRSEFIDRETKRLSNFLMLQSSSGSNLLTNIIGDFRRESRQDFQERQRLQLTQDRFVKCITQQAQSVDVRRLWPLAVSMVMVGSTVGVTTPAMPFVVQQLGITTAEYGWVVSAFALSKMLGNIPFAVLVERYGRKPYLVYSMMVISVGVGGIGLATGFESLYLCRLLTGLGVAALSTAATLTVTDISTPLNRASTFAPIMSGFAAGTAIGPALGGILVDSIGTTQTFFLVGCSYIALAGMNTILLDETKPTKIVILPWQQLGHTINAKKKSRGENNSTISANEDPSSIGVAFQKALGQWIPLLSQAPVRNVCIMNAFYWVALAGSQMTLLPLILTNPEGLNMTATQVGQVYMGMSTVQVFGGPVFAKFVDHVGKVPGIVGGCSLISASMAALPMCDGSIEQMAGVLALWATGSTLLSTSPLAYVSDQVEDDQRAQAIALLRTSGDVGFLIGASSMGALADWAGSLEMAMQSSSAILLTATGWFTVRNLLTAQIAKSSP